MLVSQSNSSRFFTYYLSSEEDTWGFAVIQQPHSFIADHYNEGTYLITEDTFSKYTVFESSDNVYCSILIAAEEQYEFPLVLYMPTYDLIQKGDFAWLKNDSERPSNSVIALTEKYKNEQFELTLHHCHRS